MAKTWGATERDDYYYEADINELIESAHEKAYERAYQAQCKRELALWERRRNSDLGNVPPS
jgi:hypothetical protein